MSFISSNTPPAVLKMLMHYKELNCLLFQLADYERELSIHYGNEAKLCQTLESAHADYHRIEGELAVAQAQLDKELLTIPNDSDRALKEAKMDVGRSDMAFRGATMIAMKELHTERVWKQKKEARYMVRPIFHHHLR